MPDTAQSGRGEYIIAHAMESEQCDRKVAAEFIKGMLVASVLARVLALSGVIGWMGSVSLGMWLWIGFPLVILASSATWQNVPWALAGIHAGDWLIKLILMSLILGGCRK